MLRMVIYMHHAWMLHADNHLQSASDTMDIIVIIGREINNLFDAVSLTETWLNNSVMRILC